MRRARETRGRSPGCLAVLAAPAAAAGPPFPDPEPDRAVYDEAGIFRPATIASAEATIDAIEARTGAEVVVYSQVVDYGITTEEADAHAQALMDQWGVGRKGFDDGLVILFDLDPSLVHGQVQLYGGPGYRAAFLDNSEKQRIFDEDMLPLLRERRPRRRAPRRARAGRRQRDAGARRAAPDGPPGRRRDGPDRRPDRPLGLIGSAVFAWLRYGRDPVYLDDPSIHMAGPPRDLTPAAAAFVIAGRPVAAGADDGDARPRQPRADLVPRGEAGCSGSRRKVGIELDPPAARSEDGGPASPQRRPAARPGRGGRRRPPPRRWPTGDRATSSPTSSSSSAASVDDFDKELESARRRQWAGSARSRRRPTAAGGARRDRDRRRRRRVLRRRSTCRAPA